MACRKRLAARAFLCVPALLAGLLCGCADSRSGPPDAARGKQVFANACSACHGATGREGGTGPSLIDERRHMDLAAAINWIEHPQAPMPALYPDTLDERQVEDVAAYVETL